jgi:hypothetical protein
MVVWIFLDKAKQHSYKPTTPKLSHASIVPICEYILRGDEYFLENKKILDAMF